MSPSTRAVISTGSRALTTVRPQNSLSAQQIQDVAGAEVKFPLYMYLRDMQQAQTAQLQEIRNDFGDMRKEFGDMKKDIAKLDVKLAGLPVVMLGGIVALAGLARWSEFFEPRKEASKAV